MAVKPDWIIHYILDVCPSNHTHGLSRYGGLELELNLPVSQEKAMMILNLLGMEIAGKGKHYRSGDRENDVFLLPVYFFETAPEVPDAYFNRVLRVLLCDPDGKYPWEPDCAPGYAEQLSMGEKREMSQLVRRRYDATHP